MVAEAVLEIRDLRKSYGRGVEALKGLNLRVNRGETVGLLGPNGAGKTTTLRIISGIIQPSGGRALLFGLDCIADALAAKERLGYVPEEAQIHPYLRGQEFLELVCALRRIPARQAKEQIAEGAQIVRLAAEDLQRVVKSYSKGMRQKLMLLSVLLHEPDFLMLDEPLSGLDAYSSHTVKHLIRYQQQQGKTILLSTHRLEMAEELCERVAILFRGELVACNTLENLRKIAGEGQSSSLEKVFIELVKDKEDQNHGTFLERAVS
jgi:ABC-2 type transport system ATP-binding protein